MSGGCSTFCSSITQDSLFYIIHQWRQRTSCQSTVSAATQQSLLLKPKQKTFLTQGLLLEKQQSVFKGMWVSIHKHPLTLVCIGSRVLSFLLQPYLSASECMTSHAPSYEKKTQLNKH